MQYSKLVQFYEKVNSTSKRLNKTHYISEFLKECKDEDLEIIIPLLQARVFPAWDVRKIGVSDRYVIKAISIATGFTIDAIEKEWKRLGDLGEAAESLVGKKKQATLFSSDLSVRKVISNIKKLTLQTGSGSVDQKTKIIAELYTSAKPKEAKYITRLILEDLRIGAGESSIKDGIVWAFLPKVYGVHLYCDKCKAFMPNTKTCFICKEKLSKEYPELKILEVEESIGDEEISKYDLIVAKEERKVYNEISEKVQSAINVSNDLALVTKKIREKGLQGLKDIGMKALVPIKVMLYPKARDMDDAFERLGRPMALEYKYDGFRLQIHRLKDDIKLFTRRLEDVTTQFPDVVKVARENIKSENFIIDSEIVGYDKKTGKYLPFQKISQRIKRKHDISQMTKDLPVIVNVFDIMEVDDKNTLKYPFKDRRALIEKIVKESKDIMLAKQLVTSDDKEANAFYEEALQVGEEGVMAKGLDAPYKPGARIGYGLKIKPVMESLDLVIVAAEWGTGKRSEWLSSFTLACVDDNGDFLEIGKVGTGFKEKSEEGLSFEQLTNLLKPLIIKEKNKDVTLQPQIVIEVNFEEIQKSPTYSSGYALRFPRVIRLRDDRRPDECSDIELIEELYHVQRGRN